MSDFLEEAMQVGEDGVIAGGAEDGVWWKPEEGDIIGGKLIKGYFQTGEYGTNPVLVIEDAASGTVFNVGCSTKILENYVNDLAPAEGTNVVIQFVGTFPVKDKPDRKYKRYIMRVEGDPDFGYWQNAFKALHAKMQMQQQAQPAAQRPSFGPDESPF